MIYILEDNDDRIERFRAAAASVAPHMTVRFWRSAHAMIADLVDGLDDWIENTWASIVAKYLRRSD
jgi:hypothetical protein